MSCKIAVFGIGYVGLTSAVLLARYNDVRACDISRERVDKLNNRISPLKDADIERFLHNEKLCLTATADKEMALNAPDFVIICTPTDYDAQKQSFDTSKVESVIEDTARLSPSSAIVIKSTVPVGFTASMRAKFPGLTLIFSPEFLREGSALHDNLFPSRIIIGGGGGGSEKGQLFASLLLQSAEKKDTPVLYMSSTEAEAVKLFANTYLALRVAFFNELDTFAELRGLNTRSLIDGICLDSRIGADYNNPSFGYGGYCLPKDTKQLRANYKNMPSDLIGAVVEANVTRKEHIAAMIIKKAPRRAGIYRLVMKNGSDNWRFSSVLGIINRLKRAGIDVIIYEPYAAGANIQDCPILSDFDSFIEQSDIIVANRMAPELERVRDKVYTRDIYALN